MSAADVTKFEGLVRTDEKLRAELAGLQGKGSASQKVAEIAQKRGLSVTAAEVDDYLKKAVGGSGELTDDALRRVAGGGWTYIG